MARRKSTAAATANAVARAYSKPPIKPRSFADEKTREVFFRALARLGVKSAAAAIAGVHRHTVDNECEQNPEFREKVERLRDQAKGLLLEHIINGSPHDWRAAAWLLERCWPNEFGARDPDSVTPEQMIASANRVINGLFHLIPPERRAEARAVIDAIAGITSSPQAEVPAGGAASAESAVQPAIDVQ